MIFNQVSEQAGWHYGFNVDLMNRKTEGQITLAAWLYEATRLPDAELQLDLRANRG